MHMVQFIITFVQEQTNTWNVVIASKNETQGHLYCRKYSTMKTIFLQE